MDFSEYIKEYGSRLYGLCLTLCRNKDDADDLYQETWLRAYSSFSSYKNDLPFEPWLAKICVNRYSSFLSKYKRKNETELLTGNISEGRLSDDEHSYTELRNLVDGLPEKQRIVIILFYFMDKDIKEISKALNVPEGTVKSRLNKGRNLLKKNLD